MKITRTHIALALLALLAVLILVGRFFGPT